MNQFAEILTSLGYTVSDTGRYLRMRPLYRDSNNNTSLSVSKEDGGFVDFSIGISGKFEELVQLTLNLTSIDEAKKWLAGKNQSIVYKPKKPEVKMVKTFSKESLQLIVPQHDYWINRGIRKEVLEEFEGGIVFKGQMAGRYVFPIFNHKREIVGFQGRDLYDNPKRAKYKIEGTKANFVWPAFINSKIIKEKQEVILVEGIGCCLALFNAGIKNVLVLFGTQLGSGLLKYLLSIPLKTIYLSLNNEPENNSIGSAACVKIQQQLLQFFDEIQVQIRLPVTKDFILMRPDDIKKWYENR